MTPRQKEHKSCSRCGKIRVARSDRRNYCIECRDDALRPIAAWMEHGACRNEAHDPEWWWPNTGDDKDTATALALRICGTCQVRDLCLDYAIQHKERHGIWGGLMPQARLALAASRRQRRAS